MSVSVGTLTLSDTAGLAGSGDGTGSLSYTGARWALNAVLDGLTYTPPAGPHVFATLRLDAQSSGASPLAVPGGRDLRPGVFTVNTTTADSGPGSLRQAILDSNSAIGGSNTIDFAIPGIGIRTIAPISPLPPITNPVLIDGTSQPGYAATPLIDVTGQALAGTDPLTITSSVNVRGVVIGGFALGAGTLPDVLTVASVPLPASGSGDGGAIDSYRLETTSGEQLAVLVHAQGVTTRLSLLDAGGDVLMQSDGQSAADGDDVINLYVPAGTYTLQVQSLGGAGTYGLTATSSPATSPLQPIGAGHRPESVVSGDFNGDGHLDLAVANSEDNTVSVLLGNGDGTFAPQVTYAVGSGPSSIVAGDFTGDGHLDLAVATSNNEDGSGEVSVLLGNGDGTFAPQVTYAVGSGPYAIVAGDFTGDGHLDLAVANQYDDTVSVLLGNGDGTFQPQVTYAVGSVPYAIVAGDFTGDGHLDLAVAGAGGVSVLLGNGDGTFAPQVTYAVGSYSTGIVAGDFNGDGHLDLAVAAIDYSGDGTRCRCCWATATAPSGPRSPTTSVHIRSRSWPETSPATAASTWPSPTAPKVSPPARYGLGVAGQWRRHIPAPGHLRGRVVPRSDRGRGFHRRRPPRPGRRQRWGQHRVGVAGQWRRYLPIADPTQQCGRVVAGRDRLRGFHRRRPPRPGRRQLR